jgi:hypothetical protein
MQLPYRGDTITFSRDLRQEVAKGLLYIHGELNTNTTKTMEAASFLYTLIELMSENCLITIEELDDHKRVIGKRVIEQFRRSGNGIMLQNPEYDKYTFQNRVEIDCENRDHLCKPASCHLPFALSQQDIREGIVHWDLGQPYLIDQGRAATTTILIEACLVAGSIKNVLSLAWHSTVWMTCVSGWMLKR